MTDNSNRTAGVAYLSVAGRRVALVGEFAYRLAKPVRTALVGADGFHGYKEKPQQGQIKAKLRNGQDVRLSALSDQTNITVVCELANGKVVTGRNMFVTDPPSADAEEAEIEMTWEGPDVSES